MAAQSATKIAKGLPKRCRNAKLKERRHASWLRTQERKKQRREENEARHRENVRRGYRLWDQQQEARRMNWIRNGEVRVARTAFGNIIRDGGRIEPCCNGSKVSSHGTHYPCVHFIEARTGNPSHDTN